MSRRRIALVGLAVVAVLLLAGCHRLGLVKSPASRAATSTPAAASKSSGTSATPAGTAAVTITVQNGGGVSGRGAAMVSRLKALGFQPSKATNAKRTDYANTIIFFNPGHAEDAARIQKALTVGKVQPATSSVTFSSAILIVVGKDF